MGGDEGERGEQLHGEIPVAHRIHRVLGDRREFKQAGDEFAIEANGRAGDRSAAEREHVEAAARVGDPAEIAVKHFDVGEQVVREIDRLRPLQVGIAGNEHVAIGRGQFDQGALRGPEQGAERVAFVAEVEAEIQGDLVIAAAGGVQLRAGVADPLGQLGLEVHVDVFEFGLEREFPRLDLRADLAQTCRDLCALLRGDQPGGFERGGVRDGARDILPPESPVVTDRLAVALEKFGGLFGKAAVPHGN